MDSKLPFGAYADKKKQGIAYIFRHFSEEFNQREVRWIEEHHDVKFLGIVWASDFDEAINKAEERNFPIV